MLDPELAPLLRPTSNPLGAEYSEFEVEGTTAYFGRWSILRDIMSARKRPPAAEKEIIAVGSIPPSHLKSNTGIRRTDAQLIQQQPIKPSSQDTTTRYAKVDMYVTRPEEWDVGAGSWHGLDWLSMVIPSQISAGDPVYSPFVSAGWSAAEEKNVRPAQYLGLLKCAAATGAEYFYVSEPV
jgi:hypothetical protein